MSKNEPFDTTNNDIECIHYLEKLEQCFKKASLEMVLSNLKSLRDRQYSNEIRAIYGGVVPFR